MLMPGINGAAGAYIKSIWAGHAKATGMGMGEIAAANANLRSLLYIIGPVFYTRVYAHFTARKQNAGAAYYMAALFGCVGPLLMQLGFTKKDMTPPTPPPQEGQKQPATPDAKV